MSETLSGQLDEFVGEAADYDDRDTGEVQETKPQRRTRKPRSGHVRAHETGVPLPGEERASVNLRHWNALVTTNPKYAKPFKRPGGFQGTAVSPTWREMRMTEHFGPIGVAWGMHRPEFQLVPIEGNGELLVYCTVRLWYIENGTEASVYGVGGDKVIRRGRDGLHTSDEAFKSAFTDALGNAMKRIGVAGDVHLGLFDDDKYIREATDAFAESTTPSNGQQQGMAKKSEPQPIVGPSPEHIATVLRTAQEKKAAGREEALAWYEDLLPEDKEILRVAKARRQARELQS